MSFRFRRSFKIAPSARINVGKRGITSLSLGGKGATLNVGKRGVHTTVGIPRSRRKRQNRSQSSDIGRLIFLVFIGWIIFNIFGK